MTIWNAFSLGLAFGGGVGMLALLIAIIAMFIIENSDKRLSMKLEIKKYEYLKNKELNERKETDEIH